MLRSLLFGWPKPPFLPRVKYHDIHPIVIEVAGAALHGWIARPRGALNGALLYFNGRRESPTTVFRFLDDLAGVAVLVFHHRGLGPSSGRPTEAALVADGLALLEWLGDETGLPPSSIVVMGRSLGSGTAVQVAAARPVAGLILVSAFDTLVNVLRHRFRLFPSRLLRDRFESVACVPRIRCPVLSITGARDTTIPVERTRSLLGRWDGSLSCHEVPEARHRGLLRYASVGAAVAAFVHARLGPGAYRETRARAGPATGDSSRLG